VSSGLQAGGGPTSSPHVRLRQLTSTIAKAVKEELSVSAGGRAYECVLQLTHARKSRCALRVHARRGGGWRKPPALTTITLKLRHQGEANPFLRDQPIL
jgi:hypothetical protein